ncbi:oxidoreductase [Candidatus Bipolaricaulota bacterium]
MSPEPAITGGRVSSHWTVADIPNLSGTVAIVSGANSGIGLEASRELARKCATVVLACRSARRGQRAAVSIRSEIPGACVEVMALDLASLASIRRFTEAFKQDYDRLDLLLNSAGVLLVPFSTTANGFESHFGINHLGHFALTGLLIERLLATAGSRIVTVSSRAHAVGRIDSADLRVEGRDRYSAARAYARSKLANLLFTYELQRRLSKADTIAVAAHPGGAATGLGRRMGNHRFYRVVLPLLEWLSQSAAQGARPILRAATDPGVRGGEYYGPSGFLGMRGRPVRVQSARRAHDHDAARRLWSVSEELTGVRFP